MRSPKSEVLGFLAASRPTKGGVARSDSCRLIETVKRHRYGYNQREIIRDWQQDINWLCGFGRGSLWRHPGKHHRGGDGRSGYRETILAEQFTPNKEIGRTIRVIKTRGSAHVTREHTLRITWKGIEIKS